MSDNPRALLAETLPWLTNVAYPECTEKMAGELQQLITRINAYLEPSFWDSRDDGGCECLTGEEVKFGR